ncbi:hypothetical protein G7046_g6920 [Stylonectria norvegica]|nr:hypothetical protein G7046_g6920 [Stylonectria norvegica]
MPLAFSQVCDLLEQSHSLSVARKSNAHVVTNWFARNRGRIDAHDTDLAALLSTLLPEKRTDRVYCIQAPTLQKIIGRAFFLGSSRIAELALYKQPGLGLDLGDCVARLLTVTPSPVHDKKHQVSVEEIDQIFHDLASKVKWSSPTIRASQATLTQSNRGDLEHLYRRFSAREAKWFTRLVLKDYQPLTFDPHLIYRLCDPILPSVLKIQDDFCTAIKATQAAKGKLLPNSVRRKSREQILSSIKPRLGVKVGRQTWLKGRSIKNCLDIGHGRMSVEEKIDGEYCQIHIDPSKGKACIQIFSKSGKDSTEDRVALHGVILESLETGEPGARVTKGCILEGELVAYDDLEHKVLPFHKIRKHVSRRGRFLGTEQDSMPGPYEHLMIIYYDVLLLEGRSLIHIRHSERFKILSDLITCRKGRAELVQRQVVDFNHSLGPYSLRKAFASSILDQRRRFSSCCIKLKKDYIGNFGDVGDFAVVGARYDPTKAKTYQIPNLKWTHFYLGCLDNKDEVERWGAKPRFTIVNVVELNETILREVVMFANPISIPADENTKLELNLAPGVEKGSPLTVVFTNPLVFDLRCFSFDKVGNTGFWSLRFPMVTKAHFDRGYMDTISFEQLQEMAKDATTAENPEDSQENLQWIARLEAADPRGIAVDAVSQLSMTTMPTPSPRRSTQTTTTSWSPTTPTVLRSSNAEPDSPLRQRLARPQLPAVPLLLGPLITPPTSSAPTAATPVQTGKRSATKRVSLSTSDTSPSKRRRSGQIPAGKFSLPTSTPESPTSKPRQPRQPLVDVDGNSQTSMASSSSVPAPKEPLFVDLTSSPESSFTTAATTKPRCSATVRKSSPVQKVTVVTVSDQDGEHDTRSCSEAKTKDASQAEVQQENKPISPIRSKSGCRYAGSQCRFASHDVLVSTDLINTTKSVTGLFEDHGILGSLKDIDCWMEEEEVRVIQTGCEPEASKILLVDSVHRPEETKSLLGQIEEKRSKLAQSRRELVTVYDWRVLKYITIMEDDSITTKDYDGWHDPWRRWYIGVI